MLRTTYTIVMYIRKKVLLFCYVDHYNMVIKLLSLENFKVNMFIEYFECRSLTALKG